MRVCVVLEQRFFQTPDRAVWTQSAFARSFWNRYLTTFDGVRVIARVLPVPEPPPRAMRTDGDGVEFAPMPYFIGPWAYLARAYAVRQAARRAIGAADAVVLRVPSHLASVLFPKLQRDARPYAAEVVGDPYEVFAPGGVQHPLRPFFRWWFTRNLRLQCRQACATSYVTAKTLQRRYPPAPDAMSIHCSSIQLDGFLAHNPRQIRSKASWRLVTVGSLAQLYKGTDTLIDAVARCTREGLNLQLTVVGEGKYASHLQQQAVAAELGDRVVFRGQLPAGAAVRAELAQADLFVLPSRTEGLPRAMIEAMACALPCIGSSAGGIPELLPPHDMVSPNDPQALAEKIREILADPQRMQRMSQRNLERASEYREDALAQRRAVLYEHLRAATTAWLEKRCQRQGQPIFACLKQRLGKAAPMRHPNEVR